MNRLAIVILFAIATAIAGEVPLRNRFLRVEQAPYPPRGFRPNQPFNLPENEATTTETPTTEDPSTSKQQLKEREELAEDVDMGVYYIYHPSGLLQRINYATKNDLKNMAYSAEYKYQDVEPLVDPIYTYDQDTFQLRQILV